MRYLLGLDLNDVVSFKQLSVDFKDSLTYVRGLNLDSDPANPTSNGAGKTLMFSAIANVFYRSTPLSIKKRSKKDILKRKTSSTGVIVKPSADGPEYEIVQTASGYKIYEDGNDLQIRTTPLAEAFINKLWPLSELEFYSTCYVSTQRPYLLQQDTDSNRLQHLTDIFRLDQYSQVRDYFAVKQRTIADNELKLSVLEQRALSIKTKLKSTKCDIDEDEYARVKARYEKCTASIDKLQRARFRAITQIRALQSLLSVEETLDKLRAEYTFKKPPDAMVPLLSAQKQAAKSWDRYEERLSHVKKLRSKVEAQLANLEVPSSSPKKLRKTAQQFEKRLEACEEQLDVLAAAKKAVDKVAAELIEVDEQYAQLLEEAPAAKNAELDYDYDADIGVAKATLKLQGLIDHEHEEGKCPTCMSDLDLQNLARTVRQAKKVLPRLQVLRRAQTLLRRKQELEQKKSASTFDRAQYKALSQEIQEAETSLEDLSRALAVWDEHDTLSSRLAELALPEAPDVERPQYALDELDAYIDLCKEIQKHLEVKNALLQDHEEFKRFKSASTVRKHLSAAEAVEAKLDSQLDALETQRSEAAALVSAHDQYRNTVDVYSKELTDTEAEIAKLKPSMEDKKLLSILVKAYGAKGLRTRAADSVCQLLQTNLNHYRDLIFAEPFEFSVKASDTGVSILVDRNNGKPDSVSDVRSLSGAESNCFVLLMVLALLALTPDSRRANFLLLDEPTSHMDQVSRQIFNERYLPVVREIVPSVFVITPHADDVSPNSAQWVVQKKNGESQLLV